MQPDILYKYCGPERIDVLKKRSIAYSNPSRLNDPMEMKPVAGFDPDETRRARDQIDKAHPEFSHIPHCPHSQAEENSDLESTLEEAAVLCLAAAWNNALMWSHYAAGHSGFVIGFDAQSKEFDARPVKYSDQRPNIVYGDGLERAILTKASYWSYEQEWRRLDPKTARHEKGYVLRPFPPSTVQEVVIGYRADEQLTLSIMSCVSSEPYRHVRVYMAYPNQDRWSVERRELSRNDLAKAEKIAGETTNLMKQLKASCRC